MQSEDAATGPTPAARLTPDLSAVEVLLDREDLDPQDAIDLGSALIALAKHAVLAKAPSWGAPEGQRSFIRASWRGEDDQELNFAAFVAAVLARGGDEEQAWALALEAVASDYGSCHDVDWALVVGRSRRLELALQMLSWVEASPGRAAKFEADVSYLSSRELRDRLLSL